MFTRVKGVVASGKRIAFLQISTFRLTSLFSYARVRHIAASNVGNINQMGRRTAITRSVSRLICLPRVKIFKMCFCRRDIVD